MTTRGLYVSVSAARAEESRLRTVLNNIANVQTTGYKQDKTATTDFHEMLLSRLGGPPVGDEALPELGALATSAAAQVPVVDFSQGPLVDTGRPLDLALSGPGFFAVQTPEGVRYTRFGNLRTDASGLLTQPDGNPVLGVNGQLHLGPGTIRVDGEGIVFVDGREAGRLRLVEIPPETIRKAGANYFEALDETAAQPARHTAVNQGFLEGSNVDSARAAIELMEVLRSYSAAQECVRLQDEVTGRAAGELGRLA